MNCLLVSLGFSALLGAASAFAQPVKLDLAFVTVPNGWHVEKVRNGSFVASPTGQSHDRSITGDSCNRLTRSDCSKSCDEAELRENYFYFFVGQSSATYSKQAGPDDFQSLHAIGAIGDPSTWVAASVFCGPRGVVYIGSTSTLSRTDAAGLLERALVSIQWQRQ